MKQLILIPAACILMTSCATIIKRNTYRLPVTSNAEHSRLVYKDSSYILPATIRVTRSKAALPLQLITDTVQRRFVVKAAPNTAFLFGNLFGGAFAPAGWLVDLSNPRRFYYGRSLHLDACDTSVVIRPQWAALKLAKSYRYHVSRYWPVKHGDVAFRISLPYANSFYFRPEGEELKINAGFWGISAGIDYAHSDNQFFRFTASGAIDFIAPVPVAVDITGEYEQLSSAYIGMTNNHQVKRFSVGYGLAYARNTWELVFNAARFDSATTPLPTRPPVKKLSHSLGFLFSGYYQFGRHFHAGIIYRPTVLNIAPRVKTNYEHLVSLDFAWSFRLRRLTAAVHPDL